MLPGMEMMGCWDLAVPTEVMQHVVKVESSFNPYAIGVVGGRLVRQPRSLPEALATVRMLEEKGYNFSVGLAQVNRYNLAKYGLSNYERAFETCPNLQAGARILAECRQRADGDWGKAFSCYYSGNFVTGYRHGYVQKVMASIRNQSDSNPGAIALVDARSDRNVRSSRTVATAASLLARRIQAESAGTPSDMSPPLASAVPAAQSGTVAAASAPAAAPLPSLPAAELPPPAPSRVPVTVRLVGAPAEGRSGAVQAAPGPRAATPMTDGKDEAFVF